MNEYPRHESKELRVQCMELSSIVAFLLGRIRARKEAEAEQKGRCALHGDVIDHHILRFELTHLSV